MSIPTISNIPYDKTKDQKKQDLIKTMEYLNLDQLKMIDEIIKTFGTHALSKGSFTDIAMKGNETNYDCALPIGLMRDAEDLGMTFESWYNVATYRSENHNSMKIENTAELFVNRLAEVFRILW